MMIYCITFQIENLGRYSRYGGCFEEDIRRLMCDRAYHITGFGCTDEVCTDSRGEKGQCTVLKRLAMMER